MKLTTAILSTALTLAITSSASADQVVKTQVRDHFETVYENVENVRTNCYMVDVPIYATRQRKGDAAGGAFMGMLLGGIAGKAVTGDDKGAAAGAIMGGVIGADKGSKPKNEQVVIGYNKERQCVEEIHYDTISKKVYSYSTLGFTLDGKRYSIDFIK